MNSERSINMFEGDKSLTELPNNLVSERHFTVFNDK